MELLLMSWLLLTLCDLEVEGHPNHDGDSRVGRYRRVAADMDIAAGDVIGSYTMRSLSDCAMSCTITDNCYGFSYSGQSRLCEHTQQWYSEYAANPMVARTGTSVYSGKINMLHTL